MNNDEEFEIGFSYEDYERVTQEALRTLMNYFDSVQILAVFQENKETMAIKSGAGCWYAREAVAREWLTEIDESVREKTRREFREHDDEET